MGRNAELPEQLSRYRVRSGRAAGGVTEADHHHGRAPDDTGCGVLHIDMDAFFAAVELRTRPELATRPVVVAGGGSRSVVLSANYPAREFGLHSAMPMAQARRLCPHATCIPPTSHLYTEVSSGVMSIFREVTPHVEQLSLDEAFLDVRGALRRLNQSPVGIAESIRSRIVADHGLTCSVGVASVKFVAKLASGMAKPDGVVVVPDAEVLQFLHPLPASSLSGVGTRTAASLDRAGIHTIGDVAETPLARLTRAVGTSAGEHLHALARGRDPRQVIADSPEKSIGAEHTFDTDQDEHEVLSRELLRLADQVATRLRARSLEGRTVSIKVRFADFTTITRSRSLPVLTDVARELHTCAVALLEENITTRTRVRLVGMRIEGLCSAGSGQQLSFDQQEPGWRDAEVAADGARTKFGAQAVHPASLLPSEVDHSAE